MTARLPALASSRRGQAEVSQVHSRLLKCALEVEDCRAYWAHADPAQPPASADDAFANYWFGARSLARIKVLFTNFRARFDAFAPALEVLHGWGEMDPETRRVLAHWHLQLADPLYRAFTGDYLVERRSSPRAEVTRDLTTKWVADHGPQRWRANTRIHYASKLLSSAYAAGLVATNRDPRPLRVPRVSDDALTYLLYLLREVDFEGTLLENPYLASVGLQADFLEERLRGLDALSLRRQADLLDFSWRHADLLTWARDGRGATAPHAGGIGHTTTPRLTQAAEAP